MTTNAEIKLLDLGKLENEALKTLGEYVGSLAGIQALRFEECEGDRWDKEVMGAFIAGLKKSDVLFDVKVKLLDNKNKLFENEIQFCVMANRKKGELIQHLECNEAAQCIERQFDLLVY